MTTMRSARSPASSPHASARKLRPMPEKTAKYRCRPTRSRSHRALAIHCADTPASGCVPAPTLGVMLYPDLVQRFIPTEIPLTDRARAMERGWESRWRGVMHDDWMNASFETAANPDPATGLPLLLLNATSVEDGKRALVSP